MDKFVFRFHISLILICLFSRSYAQLPDDFPEIATKVSISTAPGKIFLCTTPILNGVGYYVFMVNNEGTVEKYYKVHREQPIYDFKLQCDGRLSFSEFIRTHSYTGGGDAYYKFLSNDFTHETDSVKMGNEYPAESHEFTVLPNGHMLCFSYSPKSFDLSPLVPGANPGIKLYAPVIQEMDVEGKVVFQWRFWNHFLLTDLKTGADLATNTKLPEIDPVHTNSVIMDTDGNIVFSSLALANIIKISRQTGKVIWQLGGKYNSFKFVGIDSVTAVNMCYSHAFRRLPNGNVIFYSNNVQGTGNSSKAVEMKLDEVNHIATLVWIYDSGNILGFHLGNAQRLPNGNTLIGWGDDGPAAGPDCTEVDSLGNKVFELSFTNKYMYSYRAYRFEFPGDQPVGEWSDYSLHEGSFDFGQGKVNPGANLEIDNIVGDGYNYMTLSTYNISPLKPMFPGKAPRALQHKIIIHKTSIQSLSGTISFNASDWGIINPGQITVYTRKFPDKSGLFTPAQTTYNSSTGMISAGISMSSDSDYLELMFTYPDLEEVAVKPSPLSPVNSSLVNSEMPVRIEWNTDGFVSDFNVQVATDSLFSKIIVDESYLNSSVYYFNNPERNMAYYWRVRTNNEAGYTSWSATSRFVTWDPEIDVILPAGGEVFQRGSKYFMKWQTNISGIMQIDLYNGENFISTIGQVNPGLTFYWKVPIEMDSTCGYSIVVKSMHNPEINGRSKRTFSIQDSSCVSTKFPYISIKSPEGEEYWSSGETQVIRWIDNIDTDVDVELYRGGKKIEDLSLSDNKGTYSWTIPSSLPSGNNYSILVRSSNDPKVYAESISFEINGATGLRPIESDINNKLQISPNPTNSYITLSFTVNIAGPVNIALYSIDGKLLEKLDDKVYSHGKYSREIDLSKYHGKIYFIRMTDQEQTITRKIVVE